MSDNILVKFGTIDLPNHNRLEVTQRIIKQKKQAVDGTLHIDYINKKRNFKISFKDAVLKNDLINILDEYNKIVDDNTPIVLQYYDVKNQLESCNCDIDDITYLREIVRSDTTFYSGVSISLEEI